jgi:hypothetical protein
MRSMRISDLSNLNQTRTVTQDGTDYTVQSRADFVTDATGTASCEEGVASADYLKVTSTVTWPSIGTRPPVMAATIVAPPNGSVSPSSGGLAIAIEDSQNVGIPGIGVSGSGPGSFSGVTDETGCAMFGNLPAGDYSLTLSGIASGLVDRDGNPPQSQDISVVAESTNTVVLQYDDPGSIPVDFSTIPYGGGSPVPSTNDSIVVFNSGMTVARTFGTVGTRTTAITAASLFPFTSPYSVYAGTCEGNAPIDDESAAIADVTLPPGGSVPATVQLPALHLVAYTGTTTGSPRAVNAVVTIEDDFCPTIDGTPFWRTYTTDSLGQLPDPGLPASRYDICVRTADSTDRRVINNVNVQSVTSGTALNVFLGSTTGGSCP